MLRGILLMWRKEKGERERGRCFTKQLSYERKFRTMRQLLTVPLYELVLCNSQLYFYSMHKLRNYGFLRHNLKDNHCICLLSRLKITWQTTYETTPMYLPLDSYDHFLIQYILEITCENK